MPLFSIIIPTYNRSALLPIAIQSVIDQTFEDWELVIIDDGSTDNTAQVVQEFLIDQRIRYHWQENKELNGARNTGVKLSKGIYVGFLDDDDYYLKDHLQILADYISNNGQQISAIRTAMWLNLNANLKAPLLPDTDQEIAVKGLWKTPTNLLSFVFHRQIFSQELFDEDFILAEDFHFLIRVFLRYPFIQLPYYTVVYQLQEDSRSKRYYKEQHLANKLKALHATWHNQRALIESIIPKYLLNRKTNQAYLHFAKNAFQQDEKKLGWKYYSKALMQFDRTLSRTYLRTLLFALLGR